VAWEREGQLSAQLAKSQAADHGSAVDGGPVLGLDLLHGG